MRRGLGQMPGDQREGCHEWSRWEAMAAWKKLIVVEKEKSGRIWLLF
jgi:hypothetical protein